MLLIGSSAALFHGLADDPEDLDIIATEEEAVRLSGYGERQDSPYPDKLWILNIDGTKIEIELSQEGESSQDLIDINTEYKVNTPLGEMFCANVETLYLLKKSHVWHQHRWKKTFRDLKSYESNLQNWNENYEKILEKRILETKNRLKFREKAFNIPNEKFFNSAVKRTIPHDDIHEIIKFNDRPMYKYLKEDQGKATVLFRLARELPFEMQIQNYMEECMVLTLERHIIPAHLEGKKVDEWGCARKILEEMCYNYLPFDFRLDCVDNFEIIYNSMPEEFWKPVLDLLDRR